MTLPLGTDGGSLPKTTVQCRPSLLAAAAVMRTWLLWRPPPVTSVSAPCTCASSHRYSSLRALLPPPARPVASSRLTHRASSSMSRWAASRRIGSSGVGRWARITRRSRGSTGGIGLTAPTLPSGLDVRCPRRVGCGHGCRPGRRLACRRPGPGRSHRPGHARPPRCRYADPHGRFHVLAFVFPGGTSSGVHHHCCWGVIGYLQGSDEETRYRAVADEG